MKKDPVNLRKKREFKFQEMKKIYTLLLFLFFHSYFCAAQTPEGDKDNDRVEVVKMAYITRELKLTQEEAQSFWPVYNNYVNEIKQARNQYPNDEVAFEKKVVEIKEHYQQNFKKVLGNNSQRVNKVYTTDKQFNNALRNELKNRQQNHVQDNQQPTQQKSQHAPNDNGNNPNKNSNKVKDNSAKKENGNKKKPHPPL
jgi:hypothetical protein